MCSKVSVQPCSPCGGKPNVKPRRYKKSSAAGDVVISCVRFVGAKSEGSAPCESARPGIQSSPEDAAKVNPVKPTAESLAKGKKLYGYDCAMCHGEKGDGKGDMASDMKNVTDFTKPDALKNRTDGELFYAIRNGKGDMPPEGDRAKDDDIWNMVNYVRSLAKK